MENNPYKTITYGASGTVPGQPLPAARRQQDCAAPAQGTGGGNQYYQAPAAGMGSWQQGHPVPAHGGGQQYYPVPTQGGGQQYYPVPTQGGVQQYYPMPAQSGGQLYYPAPAQCGGQQYHAMPAQCGVQQYYPVPAQCGGQQYYPALSQQAATATNIYRGKIAEQKAATQQSQNEFRVREAEIQAAQAELDHDRRKALAKMRVLGACEGWSSEEFRVALELVPHLAAPATRENNCYPTLYEESRLTNMQSNKCEIFTITGQQHANAIATHPPMMTISGQPPVNPFATLPGQGL